MLPLGFSLVRRPLEGSIMKDFDVQLIGGIALNNNKIAEMKTGEGKLHNSACNIPKCLDGNGVHVITVNDYFKRDAENMGKIYNF